MEVMQLPARIRFARKQRGMSRRDVASHLNVDVTSVAAWETGRYLPRDNHRAALAKLLGIECAALMTESPSVAEMGLSASPVHGARAGQVFTELIHNCRERLSILRVTSSFPRPKNYLREFRDIVSHRILDGSLDVRVVEIFYTKERLEQALLNIFHYDECRYLLKTFSIAGAVVFPGIDMYMFDSSVFVLSSYWSAPAIDERPMIQLSGEPFASFVQEYWNEVWRHAISLNPTGAQDLSSLQEIADRMGVSSEAWNQFVSKATESDFGESIPPLP